MFQTLNAMGRAFVLAVLLVAMIPFTACTAQQIQTAQTITQIAINDIPPVLQILLAAGVLSTAQEPVAQKYADEASKDFNLVLTLIKEYKAQPTTTTADKIRSAILAGNQNLQAILATFHILNAQKQAAFAGGLGLIVANMNALLPIFPTTARASAVRASNAVVLPSPKAFKAQMKVILAQ